MSNIDFANSVKEEIEKFLFAKCLLQSGEKLEFSTQLISDGIVDSLSALEMVETLERRFSFQVEPTDLDVSNFGTVTAIVEFIQFKLSKKLAGQR